MNMNTYFLFLNKFHKKMETVHILQLPILILKFSYEIQMLYKYIVTLITLYTSS